MRDDEMLQKLLRLKQYETPGPEYFERFLDEFHARMARESRARHGLRDRMFTWVEELFPSPRLGWSAAAGGMMAVVAFAFVVSHNSPVNSPGGAGKFAEAPVAPNGVELGVADSELLPTAGSLAAAPAETRPTPIIYPELIAPVSYTSARSGSDAVNLAAPSIILRRSARDEAFQLRSQLYGHSPDADDITVFEAPMPAPR